MKLFTLACLSMDIDRWNLFTMAVAADTAEEAEHVGIEECVRQHSDYSKYKVAVMQINQNLLDEVCSPEGRMMS